MLQEIGLAKKAIDNMKTGSMPSADKLATIANYLEVSTDFLLGNENSDVNDKLDLILSKDEEKLLNSYRELSNQGKEYILQTIVLAQNTYKKRTRLSDMETAAEIS